MGDEQIEVGGDPIPVRLALGAALPVEGHAPKIGGDRGAPDPQAQHLDAFILEVVDPPLLAPPEHLVGALFRPEVVVPCHQHPGPGPLGAIPVEEGEDLPLGPAAAHVPGMDQQVHRREGEAIVERMRIGEQRDEQGSHRATLPQSDTSIELKIEGGAPNMARKEALKWEGVAKPARSAASVSVAPWAMASAAKRIRAQRR